MAVQRSVQELEKILQVLEGSSQGLRFYGASILIIYCSESLKLAEASQDFTKVKLECKLIDF